MLLFVGQRNGDAVPFVFACLDFFAVYLEYVLGITAAAAVRRNNEYEIIGKEIALDGIMGAVAQLLVKKPCILRSGQLKNFFGTVVVKNTYTKDVPFVFDRRGFSSELLEESSLHPNKNALQIDAAMTSAKNFIVSSLY